MITEFIEFELREGIGNRQLIHQANKVVTDFHKKQDGYVDMELVSDTTGKTWQMIVHYQTMEDIEKVKTNIPHSQAIREFTGLIKADSMKVSFYDMERKWTS